jgi:DNA polymerase I-like protein with 3'-5' exonuclease and polymerase domains
MAFREFQKKGIDARPLMWIHDEVVWRVPKGLALECKEVIDKYMKSYKLETPLGRVPLDVEGHIADRWTK